MSEAAVLEAPADATTETKADAVIETKDTEVKDPVVTDDDDKVQTETGPDDPEGEADEDDHEAQLKQEAEDARVEARLAEKLAEKAEADRVQREAEAETARKNRASKARVTAIEAAAALAEPAKLDPKDGRLLAYVDPTDNSYETVPAKNLTDIIEKLNLDVEAAADLNVQAKWWNGIERALPDDATRKDFETWQGDGKPVHEVISKLAEMLAPKTEWAKKLTLDDAIAASSEVKQAVAKAKSDEYERGRKKGREDRGKNPDARERTPVTATNYTDLTKMKGADLKNMPDDAFLKVLNGGK